MRYLYHTNEAFTLEYSASIVRHPKLSDGQPVLSAQAGDLVRLKEPGHYLIHEHLAPGRERCRYLGIVGEHSTVMQLTVGAFTSDNFDTVIHEARVPAVYYVKPSQVERESTFRGFEQDYGDEVLPHVMANSLGLVSTEFAQTDPNWDCLSTDAICERLRALAAWWEACGLQPLRGIATYTPSNSLVCAMKDLRLDVLHSIVPEQNWSDGNWVINHWGMLNQPFYVSDEDFRKPASRDAGGRNLLAMSMNSYHANLPHQVGFGDFVLSPSHFLRWHRSVEGGAEPMRFTNFLHDYLQVARGNPDPFFLIAGFEFGRTFGTRSMTQHNRRGIEQILQAAREFPVVFATARDVASYYEVHCERPSEAVFTQRDYQTGNRMMDKPVNAGPSITVEMHDFKASFSHRENLPCYHYDYCEAWQYAAGDSAAPRDYAADNRHRVQVEPSADQLTIRVDEPLPRAVPVAVWDALADISGDDCGIAVSRPPVLDDDRTHTVLILPKGWSGTKAIPCTSTSNPSAAEFSGLSHPLWRVQRIGDARRSQHYLYLETGSPEALEIDFITPGPCRIESRECVLGDFKQGERVPLRFHGRNAWYRFHGLTAEQIQPDAESIKKLDAWADRAEVLRKEATELLAREQAELDKAIEALIPASEKRVLHLDCFGNAIDSERSRALPFDRVVYCHDDNVFAREFADGGIANEPGRSAWVHPRGLHFEVKGLNECLAEAREVVIYLFSRSPQEEKRSYIPAILSGGQLIAGQSTVWTCPEEVGPEALFQLSVLPNQIVDGTLDCRMPVAQRGVLDDWFRDHGYIAALERLIITLR